MNDKLISVIVPIYMVENYLNKCVDSIINQTYNNLEIILVDDGSKDSCASICDEYKKIDSRIKVIHKVNGGLSDARNVGLEESNGDIICFIDSDDFINPNMIEILYNNMISTEADISMCSYLKVSENENVSYTLEKETIRTFTNLEALNNLYDNDLDVKTVVAWNKLYKRKLWDNVRYPKGKIHEDEYVIHYILLNSKKIVYTNLKLYYYLQRESSITSVFNYKRLDALNALKERIEIFKKENMNQLFELASYKYFYTVLFFSKNIQKKDKEVKIKIKKELFLALKNIYKLKTIKIIKKIKLTLIYIVN